MTPQNKQALIENYASLFLQHGDCAAAVQWSEEGQQFRFRKLLEIANLRGSRVLDLGCGLGALYPALVDRFGELDYSGVDIVPQFVQQASCKFPRARFLCRDVLVEPLDETFDYVLISGMFNNAYPGVEEFLPRMISAAFAYCTKGLGFNCTSSWVNHSHPEMAYHDPVRILDFCLRELSRKVTLCHHYERCDTAVFVYRSR